MRMTPSTRIGLVHIALCAALFAQPAQAQSLCPSTWPQAFTAKAKAILELLANSSFKRTQPVNLANCVREAAVQIDIESASTEDPENLARVLRQVADFQRTTATTLRTAGDSGAAAYWLRQEADFRVWYLEQLGSPVKPPPTTGRLRQVYLEGVHFLMDDYENVNTAQPVASWMEKAPPATYYPATYDIWLRAVASCSSWNFKDAANSTDAALKTNLCSPACRTMATTAREAIEDFASRAPAGDTARLRTMLGRTRKALDSCGSNP